MRVNLEQAISKLKNGGVVAIPTETVYGLAADATNENALLQIYAIKKRPANNPLIVHIADISHVENWVTEFPPLACKLAEAFWPGPLTLVLPAKASVSNIVRAGEPTVALRVPSHPMALQLLKLSGLGLAAPSANKYTQLSPTTAAHVQAGLGDEIAVLDGGACEVGIESTIVSVLDNDWRLLRHGMITEAEIVALTGKPALASQVNLPKAPGQHLLHYSPHTPLQLFSDRAQLIDACKTLTQQNLKCAALLVGEGDLPNCKVIQFPTQPEQVAEQLYSALHTLDDLKLNCLLVELPPNNPTWAAIYDRLSRAGHAKASHAKQ
ncbi:MAG TPA: L-threonylcarbamoyladenylate synthase [Methylotenera sp.]|nr:L-threonylcarbamoyladenylate synthase [Methylotenera sp.]